MVDVLYGVTMQESGVSRLVSVNLAVSVGAKPGTSTVRGGTADESAQVA